jgi:hypothetical protein
LLRIGAISLGGLTLPSLLRQHAVLAGPTERVARAKSVVILYLSGGPSQLDMWDMKPQAPQEVRGTFRPISTSVPGIQICEHMPRMALLADKYAIVRSMTHNETDHLKAGYWVMTGGQLSRPVRQASGMQREDRPHLGAVLSKTLGAPRTVPSFVMAPEYISPVGVARPGQYAGFLGAAHDPYLIDSDPNLPDYSPGPIAPAGGISSLRLHDRRGLLAQLDQYSRGLERSASIQTMNVYKQKAFDLISGPDAQRALRVDDEPDKTRDRYGRHIFGQATLLARRLVEAGVRLVQVNFIRHDKGKGGQGYDSHSVPPNPPHLAWAETELLPPTDAAFSALVEDLDDRGLLDETLVVMMGEFGRTPTFNKNAGRDHWSLCYSLVLAGGGIRGGQVYGASDKIAAYPVSDPVTPGDLLATVYHLVGVDHHAQIYDPLGRPYPLAEGQPVSGLL